MIDLAGSLEQATLDQLRSTLGLSKAGRLGDDWDELFGEAKRTVAGASANVELWRDVDSHRWRLDIELVADPAESDVQSLLTVLRAEVEATGVQIASVSHRR
ncbi:hypothetical protein [Micromonospora sp. NPDC005173]|uniref:hypothetical protein n=1 Tax=Micromonospora sp. NPDC005173 TaxID=3157165 RepID=UPI0033BB9083